jgi:hypothetical protein
LESIIGCFADRLAEDLAAAVERIERLRPAHGTTPFNLRHRLRDGRFRDRRCGNADAGGLQELTTLHVFLPLKRQMQFVCGLHFFRPTKHKPGRAHL